MRTTLISIAALLCGAALLLTGNGLQNVLVPYRAAVADKDQFVQAGSYRTTPAAVSLDPRSNDRRPP